MRAFFSWVFVLTPLAMSVAAFAIRCGGFPVVFPSAAAKTRFRRATLWMGIGFGLLGVASVGQKLGLWTALVR